MSLTNERTLLFLSLTVLGAVNAVIRPISRALGEQSSDVPFQTTLGVNPVIWVALLLTLVNLAGGSGQRLERRDLLLAAVVMGGLIIPSATASWLVLALFAAWMWCDTSLSRVQRSGAAILFAVSLREPVLSTLTHLLNTQILGLDAMLAAAALAPFEQGIYSRGNLVLGSDGVRLVVLTSCSSLANLSFAMIFWYAVSQTLQLRMTRPAWWAGVAIALSVIALNIARLAIMSSSGEWYETAHGASGKAIFSVAMLVVVMGLTTWGVRHVFTGQAGTRTAGTSRSG